MHLKKNGYERYRRLKIIFYCLSIKTERLIILQITFVFKLKTANFSNNIFVLKYHNNVADINILIFFKYYLELCFLTLT